MGFTRRGKTKQKHNAICVGHHFMQTNTNNINKACALLQTIARKDHRFYAEIVTDFTTWK